MKNAFLSVAAVQVKHKYFYSKCCTFRTLHTKFGKAYTTKQTCCSRNKSTVGLYQTLQSNSGLQYTPDVTKADTVLHSILRSLDGLIHFCSSCVAFVARRLGLHSWFHVLPSNGKLVLHKIQVVAALAVREVAVLLFLIKVWPKIVRSLLYWLRKTWIQVDVLGTKVLNKVTRKETKDDSTAFIPWSETLLKASEQPLILSLWVFALLRLANLGTLLGSSAFYAVEHMLHLRVGENIVGQGLGKLSFVVLFGWFLERWRKLVFENLGSSWKTADFMDRSLFLAYERLMQALNYLIISFLLYEYVGISFAPIFAISGLGGIALSLAARDFVSNVFGSIMIYLTRPFTVGDRIRSKDGSVSGSVEKIGWYSSEVLNDEGLVVFVPNSTFTSAVITNLSRVKKIPFQRKISLSKVYLPNLDRILNDVRTKLQSHPAIDSTVTPTIYVTDVRDGIVEIEIRCILRNSSEMDERLARQSLLIELGDLEQQLKVAGAT